MMFNRMMVIWFVIPMIIVLIIGLPWFIWHHFPSVRTTCKTMCLVVIRRRAMPESWKKARERVKKFHTTKIKPRLKEARSWIWKKTKAHFKRGLFLGVTAAFCAAVILLGWWGVVTIYDNSHTVTFGSKPNFNTGVVIRFLVLAVGCVACLVGVVAIFHFVKKGRHIIKSAAGGTWKLVTGTKEFLKFFALSVVWWVVVGTFAYLQKEFPTPWEFLWEKHQSLTIITSALLLVWSFLWFFRENSKPISWGVKIVSLLLLGLWANTAWNTETVKNFRGDGVSWARGIGTGSSRGPSVHQLVTGSNSFTVTKDRWETFIVPAYHNIAYEALGPVKFKRKTTRGKVEEFELVGGVRIPPATNADGSPAEVSSVAFKAIAEPTQVEIKALQVGGRRSTPESNNSHIVFEGG